MLRMSLSIYKTSGDETFSLQNWTRPNRVKPGLFSLLGFRNGEASGWVFCGGRLFDARAVERIDSGWTVRAAGECRRHGGRLGQKHALRPVQLAGPTEPVWRRDISRAVFGG